MLEFYQLLLFGQLSDNDVFVVSFILQISFLFPPGLDSILFAINIDNSDLNGCASSDSRGKSEPQLSLRPEPEAQIAATASEVKEESGELLDRSVSFKLDYFFFFFVIWIVALCMCFAIVCYLFKIPLLYFLV